MDHEEARKIFQPLHDVVVLDPQDEVDMKTKGGIIVPVSAVEKEITIRRATVVACGPGRQVEPAFHEGGRLEMPIKAGDKVFYHTRSCHAVGINGHTFLMTPVTEVVCVIKE